MEWSPSGRQWTISHGAHEATVVEVGGGLRAYTVGGVDVLAGYGRDEQARSGRGQILIPWPNRLRDGRYTFEGTTYQLALSEPARHNASHGLVRWALWSLLRRSDSELTVGYRLHPQQGWAGILEVEVTYSLGEAGLTVATAATNRGGRAVPFGYGAHPYVALGDSRLEDAVLTVPAEVQVLVDERLLPCGAAPVPGSEVDFRQPRALGRTRLDTAFTALTRDADGCWRVTVDGLADRPAVTVWGDEAFDWVQVFTAQGEASGGDGTRGIAVEPMSCPADAFNSGDGVVTLRPGERWSGRWGLAVHQ